jgi:threonine dehydrogenase-like Zn-dependent dehydrogenase
MLAAIAAGASSVAVSDPLEEKRRHAIALGAAAAFDPMSSQFIKAVRESLPHRPDVVFDCVAGQTSIAQAIALAEKGGSVIVIGVPRGPVEIPLPVVQDREIRIQGSAMYVEQDVLRAIDLIRDHTVDAERMVTATYPLEQAAEAFAAARSGNHLKVQVQVVSEPL